MLQAKAGILRKLLEFSDRVFVGVFRSNVFTAAECKCFCANSHSLTAATRQADIDTVFHSVVKRQMLEVFQIKIAIQFAINSPQKIQVELCGNAAGVVVRGFDRVHIFL